MNLGLQLLEGDSRQLASLLENHTLFYCSLLKTISLNLPSVTNIPWFWFLLCSASSSCLLAFAKSDHLHTSTPLAASLVTISLLLGATFRAPCLSPFTYLSCLSLPCLTPPYSPIYKSVIKAAQGLFCPGLLAESTLSHFMALLNSSSSPTSCNASR